MSAFWAYVNALMHLQHSCEAWVGPWSGSQTTSTNVIVYGGNCVQAWLLSATSHGAVFWGWLPWLP